MLITLHSIYHFEVSGLIHQPPPMQSSLAGSVKRQKVENYFFFFVNDDMDTWQNAQMRIYITKVFLVPQS